MILIPGSLSFAKLAMMSSAPAKSAGDARYVSQDPFIQYCPIKSGLQSVLEECILSTSNAVSLQLTLTDQFHDLGILLIIFC